MIIKVNVRSFAHLREVLGEGVELEFAETITLKDLLNFLVEKYGRHLKNLIYDENGKVKNFLLLIVNGEPVTSPEDFNKKLENGSVVSIMPVVSGG